MLNTVEFELYFDTVTHDKSRKTASVPIQLCKQLSTWLYGKSLIPEDYARFVETKHEKRDEYFRDKENADKNRKQIFSDEDIVKFYNPKKALHFPKTAEVLCRKGRACFAGCRLKGEEMVTAFISVVNCRLLCF